jgi:nitroreductase
MAEPLSPSALDQIFLEARTWKWWTDDPVAEADIRAIYELMKWGPTASNTTPARFVWVTSEDAKARLEPLLDQNNSRKTLKAPATVIVGYDLDFHEQLGLLIPHAPNARSWFEDPEARSFEALRSSTLQAAYLIIAARALGWDCGPQGGIDRAGIDREFFAGANVRTNFIISIGRGHEQGLKPRAPRLSFEQANRIV